jgi:hypothetical protein
MIRTRTLPALALALGLLSLPLPPRADPVDAGDVAQAMARMAQADRDMQAGRPAAAFQGYLAVLKRFPTWWLPTVKAGVAARALRMPDESVDAWLARARTLEPQGDLLPLVTLLLALDRDAPDPSAELLPVRSESDDPGPDGAAGDPAASRLAMARALAFERDGRIGAAILEYRALLARDATHQAARFRLAGLLAGTGRTGEAATLFREGEARSLNPARWREAARRAGVASPGAADGSHRR